MKYMFNTVKECAEDYQKILENSIKQETSLDFKEIGISYAMDVINSTAFGWKTNSMYNPNEELRKISRTAIRGTARFRFRRLFYMLFPFLKGYVNIFMLPTFMRQFFLNIIQETVQYRKETGYKRNDFLQLLMSLNEQKMDKVGSEKVPRTHNQHELGKLVLLYCTVYLF